MPEPRYWTDDRIIAAIQAHAEKHGRAPAAADWAYSTFWHPHTKTVLRWFGTWNAAIAAAGFQPRPAKRLGVGRVRIYQKRADERWVA